MPENTEDITQIIYDNVVRIANASGLEGLTREDILFELSAIVYIVNTVDPILMRMIEEGVYKLLNYRSGLAENAT